MNSVVKPVNLWRFYWRWVWEFCKRPIRREDESSKVLTCIPYGYSAVMLVQRKNQWKDHRYRPLLQIYWGAGGKTRNNCKTSIHFIFKWSIIIQIITKIILHFFFWYHQSHLIFHSLFSIIPHSEDSFQSPNLKLDSPLNLARIRYMLKFQFVIMSQHKL